MLPLSFLLALAVTQDPPRLLPPAVLFAPEVVDHRRSQSPVKNQGDRGTCAAFAITGALETFPGVPTDLCEQLLYATVKLHEQDVDVWLRKLGGELSLSEGNALREYVPLFERVGTCHERVWPYDPGLVKAGPNVPEEIRSFLELARIGDEQLRQLRDSVGKWGFRAQDAEILEDAAAQDIERIRGALRSGVLAIPVGYTVHVPRWFALGKSGASTPPEPAIPGVVDTHGQRFVADASFLEQFAELSETGLPSWMPYTTATKTCRAAGKDLVQEVREGRWLSTALHDLKEYGGHAVLIVGFDARGFLVKNSWGTDWADGGYCVVSYDYHRLYAGSALILRAAQLRNPALSPFESTKRVREGRFRVKVQPRKGPLGDMLQVSTWMEDARDANYEVADYTLEVCHEGGDWRTLAQHAVLAGPPDARTGAPWDLGGLTATALAGAREARLRVRYGVDVLDPKNPREARFIVERTFPSFPTSPTGALDLLPNG